MQPNIGFYPIVQDSIWIEQLLSLGVKTIQLRIKNQPMDYVEAEVVKSIALARLYNAALYINDYWQLAILHQAPGVHLGIEDIQACEVTQLKKAGIKLGISTHTDLEMQFALAFDPTYVASGPIFPTSSKRLPYSSQGLTQLKHSVESVSKPIVAIGGITLDNCEQVIATGVKGFAVISALTKGHDAVATTHQFLAYAKKIVD